MDRLAAKALRGGQEVAARLRERDAPHVADLNEWVRRENEKRGIIMPWFDPGDAGTSARVMLLLESPGPKSTATGGGSGVISVDNNDATAANCWALRRDASLLDGVVHWNAVPWYLGSSDQSVVAPGSSELRRGVSLMRSLLPLLPELRVVVPMGNAAKRMWGLYCDARPNNLIVVPTWHPSGQGLAGAGKRAEVLAALVTVRRVVDDSLETPPQPLRPRFADSLRRAPERTGNLVSHLRKRGQRRLAAGQGSSRSQGDG